MTVKSGARRLSALRSSAGAPSGVDAGRRVRAERASTSATCPRSERQGFAIAVVPGHAERGSRGAIAWFFMGEVASAESRPGRRSPTRGARRTGADRAGRQGESRDVSIVEAVAKTGSRAGLHAHTGDEHHVVLSGRWRMSQGDHVVDLGPGDYLRWDGSIPHDAEVIGPDEGRVLIITLARR